MNRADSMAEEISNVDREELLKRIEDENLFNKSFTSDSGMSVSSKTRTQPVVTKAITSGPTQPT